VTVLHVVTPGRTGASVTDAVEQTFAENAGGDRSAVRTKLVQDEPGRAAVGEAQKGGYDLVLVGAGAPWGLEPRLFGMVSERLVRESPASLLIVHSGPAGEVAREPMRDPYPTAPLSQPPPAAAR
jgi:nucleotide-binding universal stress UspA family protein